MNITYTKLFAFHKFDDLVDIWIAPSCTKKSDVTLTDKNNILLAFPRKHLTNIYIYYVD